MASPIRILTAVPICDGHDSAINTINLEFIRHGIEVVYLGFHRYAGDIVRAAIQEDVAAIGISSYNGGHIDFFADVVSQLKKNGANDIAVFGGGGGTITHDDARQMKRKGVDEIFFAGTSLTEMADYVKKHYGKRKKRRVKSKPDLALLARSGFDYVIIETVGTGQEALPFRNKLVDQTVLVMNPDYGARLQLQKIVMLDVADVVVVNKTDLERAKAALSEIEYRLTQNKRKQEIVATVAKRHRDPGVDELFELITKRKRNK